MFRRLTNTPNGYSPLSTEVTTALQGLANRHFTPEETPPKKDDIKPVEGYTRLTDALTKKEREAIEKHQEETEKNFKRNAY